MMLTSPAYLSLLAFSALIILLYSLHTHRRRREVPALALWERLPTDPQTRAARIWVRVDALLMLQLLVLTALALALSGPALPTERPRLESLAIVLDGSASVRAKDGAGRPIVDLIRDEALALLDHYPTTPVAVLELSASPRVVAPVAMGHDETRRALASWEPTWFGNGSRGDLAGLLASQDCTFERVIFLTDVAPDFSLDRLETVVFGPGENLALIAFNVREDPTGGGPVAFVRLRNDTSTYREVDVRVSDGSQRAYYPALVAPGEEQALVLPFPASSGTVFTASIDGQDAFAADDARTFSLARRAEVRVRVVGTPDRYLRAALASAGARLLDPLDSGVSDLALVCGDAPPEGIPGNVLLVHGTFPGVVDLGTDREGDPGPVSVVAPGDPLLAGLDPLDFVLRSSPVARVLADGVTVLSAGGRPLLWRSEAEGRRVVFLAADPVKTNLPLTVDFPILVWNALRWLAPNEAPPPDAVVAGEPIAFNPYGTPQRLRDPDGRETAIDPQAAGFLARSPGVYELTASSHVYSIAVNVAASESPRTAMSAVTPLQPAEHDAEQIRPGLFAVWRAAAVLALALVSLESLFFQRLASARRRP